MKLKILIIMFTMITSLSFAQNGTVNAVSNKNYMFSESYSNSNYACSITFKKEFKDSVNNILNTYFENKELLKKKIVWKKFKEDNDSNNIFYVVLKKRSLKIEWKNNENANIEIVEKLKKFSREIIESLNKK
jgi:Skp family chaperone for outer membrane proteins